MHWNRNLFEIDTCMRDNERSSNFTIKARQLYKISYKIYKIFYKL